MLLPLGARADNAPARLSRAGLSVLAQGDEMRIAMVTFGSPADRLGLEAGFVIRALEVPTERPAKEWLYLPTLALLGLVIGAQRRRAGSS